MSRCCRCPERVETRLPARLRVHTLRPDGSARPSALGAMEKKITHNGITRGPISAMPMRAARMRTLLEVRVVPKADVSNRSETVFLLDHHVGAGEHRGRHVEAD